MLRNVRLSWWSHWALLAVFILPRRYRWLVTPANTGRGEPINQEIIDPTGTQAMRVCAAGLMSGLCSPSRPWFKLRPAVEVELDREAQLWFDEVEERIYAVMAHSNYYDSKAQQYEDLVTFGTAPKIIYEDEIDVIRCYNPCAGEYFLAVGSTFRVESFYRLFVLTVAQIIEMFGLENCPTDVQEMWRNKAASLEVERTIAHAIEPNFPIAKRGVQPGSRGSTVGVIPGGFAYREMYWVWGTSTDFPLAKRGFNELPFTAPRWATTANDPYGRCPGMDTLPDIMQLQRETVRKAQGIDKQVNPPLIADVTMKNEPSSTLPGHITYVPKLSPETGMRPVYTVDPKLEHMTADIKDIQQRVQRGFFNDLFLMISADQKTDRTAYEIAARQQEKLQVLGPVIERLQNEDLAPDIKRIMNIMQRRHLLPPLPPSLRGIGIKIEYVSMLALAQRAAETAGMERLAAMTGRLVGAKPDIADNVDWDEFLREYGDRVTVKEKIFTARDQMEQTRKQRAQAQAKQQQAQEMQNTVQNTLPAAAGTAETLANTPVGQGVSALNLMIGDQAAPPLQ